MCIIFVYNSEGVQSTLNKLYKLIHNSGLLLSTCRYIRLIDRACWIPFIYNINNGPNIDSSGTPQFMVAASKNMLSSEKKNYVCQMKVKPFFFLSETPMHFILSNKIFWSKVSKAFWREDQLKSYKYVAHFQHHLKSHQLIKKDTYLWNDLL